MKKARFTENQIVNILKLANSELGTSNSNNYWVASFCLQISRLFRLCSNIKTIFSLKAKI